MNAKDFAKELIQELAMPFEDDTAPPKSGLDIEAAGSWLSVGGDVWRAWSGRRMLWGIEYHGPVYALGTPEGSQPWDGARTCGCHECQRHVRPELRPN